MPPTLVDAYIALEKRKEALVAGCENVDTDAIGMVVPADGIAPMFVGFDIDPDQLNAAAMTVSTMAGAAIRNGDVDEHQALLGCWVDGLLLGLMLTDLRQQEAAREAIA